MPLNPDDMADFVIQALHFEADMHEEELVVHEHDLVSSLQWLEFLAV